MPEGKEGAGKPYHFKGRPFYRIIDSFIDQAGMAYRGRAWARWGVPEAPGVCLLPDIMRMDIGTGPGTGHGRVVCA